MAEAERTWPGQVFEREGLSYTEAMGQFVAAREVAAQPGAEEAGGDSTGDGKAERRALARDVERLRRQRRAERERRRAANQAWKAQKEAHRQSVAVLSEKEAEKRAAIKAQWRAERAERHRELMRQRAEDERWRQERRQQRERQEGIALVTAWIAVLVIVDNCTRRCLGLPLFVVGAHVTAELVVAALQALLPAELQYLISDGGKQFTAEAMQRLAKERGFVRVPLARHRPESNGIAERFVGTLKEWLLDKEWRTDEELRLLLLRFLVYYNDRPHRGYELAGLSPNEYAARMAVI